MRFLFACGGTAGHVNPAVGVAGRIRELLPDSEILFIGALGKMEMELVPPRRVRDPRRADKQSEPVALSRGH